MRVQGEVTESSSTARASPTECLVQPCMRVHGCACAGVCVYMHTHVCLYVRACMWMGVCMCICGCVCARM